MSTSLAVNPVPAFHSSPWPQDDLIGKIFQYLALQDVGSCLQVNKAWCQAMNQSGVWLTMFDNEKIPEIPSRPNTIKEDFFSMRKITLSKRQAAPIGVFVGDVPPISEKTFKFLMYGKDHFEPSKYNHETHVVIVEPTHFIVPYDAIFLNVFYCLFDVDNYSGDDENFEYRVAGDDIEIDDAKTTMKIPYTWFSVMQLGLDSWSKIDEDDQFPFFDPKIDRTVSRIFKETIKVSKAVNVYIMRIDPPEIVKDQKYSIQRQILNAKGYEVAPFGPRIYFNMIGYFSKGQCPDGNLALRTSDVTEEVHEDLSQIVGSKISEFKNVGIGDTNLHWDATFPLITIIDADRKDDDVSAAAGFPAELEGFEQMPGGMKRTHGTAFDDSES
jgi:hypothetical protein